MRPILTKLGLALGSLLLIALIAEIGLRLWQDEPAAKFPRAPMPPPLHVSLPHSPIVYGLNPAHPEVSEQGLRDRVYAQSKPANVRRVLVLGDSITYGVGVEREQTFPHRLEEILAKRLGDIEVLNTGVTGYSSYNELQYYQSTGRDFSPDVVVVAFCFNDLVDPALHWKIFSAGIETVPERAIPSAQYHVDHALPKLAAIMEAERVSKSKPKPSPPRAHSLALVRFTEQALERIRARFADEKSSPLDLRVEVSGVKWPSYVTGEDDFSLDLLEDPAAPQWRWLASIYDELRAAVQRDGAELAIIAVPLAYQLDDGYPLHPQRHLESYAASREIPYLDLLPALRAKGREETFLGTIFGYHDVWHLSVGGHEVVAEALARLLADKALFPPDTAGGASGGS